MYFLAFSGSPQSPILYSFDNKEWYFPNGQFKDTIKISDNPPIPGKNYFVGATPEDKFTVIVVNSNNNPVLISYNERVYLSVDGRHIEGRDYQQKFFLICPVPEGILNGEMTFKDQMINNILINLPELPFIQRISNNIFITGDVKYVPGSNQIDPRYNDHLPRYRLDGGDILISCPNDNESDYFKRRRINCTPCNDQTLNTKFPNAQMFLIDGFFHNFVVKYSNNIEVYPLQRHSFLFGMGHYEVNNLSNKWKDYYRRRLNCFNY